MRRRAPRPLSDALRGVVEESQPATLLARVQRAWPDAAGAVLAAQAEPVSERDGVVTVACSAAIWAQEGDLLGPDVLAGLHAHPALAGAPRVERLRFTVGSGAKS